MPLSSSSENAARLSRIAGMYQSTRDELLVQHPEWNATPKDERLSIFNKCMYHLSSCMLSIHFWEDRMKRKDFWPDDIAEDEKTRQYLQYGQYIKQSLLLGFFSCIESSLRGIVRILEPATASKMNFYSVGSRILREAGLQNKSDYDHFIKLISYLRNGCHNNYIFYPHNNQNSALHYKGQIYNFEVGEVMQYYGLDQLFVFIEDAYQVIRDIMMSAGIQKLPPVGDQFIP